MQEHLITPPANHSYQFRTRNILERLSTGIDADTFKQVKDDLDVLTWKADKQVKALKDQLQWMQEAHI